MKKVLASTTMAGNNDLQLRGSETDSDLLPTHSESKSINPQFESLFALINNKFNEQNKNFIRVYDMVNKTLVCPER